MKKLMIPLFTIFFICGCTTTSKPTCEQNNTFTMEFTNGSSDPYNLYINDVFQSVVDGKTKVTYNIPAGYWSAKVVQKSGYIISATVVNYSNTTEACTSNYIIFP